MRQSSANNKPGRLKMKRKAISFVLSVVMLAGSAVVPPIAISAVSVSAAAIAANADVSRAAAAEGIVLLQNNGVLPLKPASNIALFGYSRAMNGSSYITDGYGKDGFVTYGGGSGEVTAPYIADLYTGLNNSKAAGRIQSVTDAGISPTADAVNAAALTNDTAVVVIRRFTAEGSDLSSGAGGYLLSAAETTLMQNVNAAFSNVVVVMNVGNALDMTWTENYNHISAVVMTWFPGMEGGDALADVLTGVVNPSGKLVDTFARSYNDYPSSATFGQSNPQYTDDIYVGYRYFATADPDYQRVKYEFGYGLSYSTFSITNKTLTVDGTDLVATATVTNNGPYPGKEVLQTYYAPPAGALNKPAFELAAYAKTGLLAVGQSQTLQMRFPISGMASYDDVGKTGVISAYVLEAGDYNVYIGDSIKNATKSAPAGKYTQAALQVTEQLSKKLAPATAFDRLVDPVAGTYQSTSWTPPGGAPTPGTPNPIPGPAAPPARVTWTGTGPIMLEDVYKQPGYIYDFVAQFTTAQLQTLSINQGSTILTNGTGALGKMPQYDVPEVNTADGPAGLRIGSIGSRAVIATSFPVGTMLACTWNPDIIKQAGAAVAAEMKLNRVDIWLAPGMNIHRNPCNGRNFEYYSEDPLVAGKCAAAMTEGVQGAGGLVTLKHFAANNQETNRYASNSQVSERALREIYLKGFEIAVKQADPACVMTSYNFINGTHTEASVDLLTGILRNEWGFKGMVMTDWWNTRASWALQIAAGCNLKNDNTDSSINNVTTAALQANVIPTMNTIMRSFAFAQLMSPDPVLTALSVDPLQLVVGKASTVTATVAGRNLDGQDVQVGIKGYPSTFVSVPGNTGGTVSINIPAGLLPIGNYTVVMTLNGVESTTTASLRVDVEKAYYYLVAARNNMVVGADPATFNTPGSMTTMVANLSAPNSYAQFEMVSLVADRVCFKMMNGYLVTMEGSSYGSRMVRPRTAVPAAPANTGWEELILEDQGDGTIKIKRIGTDGTWYVDVAANGNLSTIQNSVGDTGKFTLVPMTTAPDPVISGVTVTPSQINAGEAANLSVAVSGMYLTGAQVSVGIKGFANSFVTVPGDTGATVTIPVTADMLAAGSYDVTVMLNGADSGVKGSLLVVPKDMPLPKEGDTIYLIANSNGKIVGADPGTFGPPVDDTQLTMSANLDAANDYALLTVHYQYGNVYLQAKNGLDVSMEGAAYGNNKVRPRTDPAAIAADGWEALQFEVQTDNTVKIKRVNSFDGIQYIDVGADGSLSTVPAAVGDTGKFRLVIVGGVTPPGPVCKVSFNYNYPGAPANPADMTVAQGAAIGNLPVPPMRAGFVFNGWCAYDGNTTVSATNTCLMPTFYNADTVINNDTTLVANWSHVLDADRNGSQATVYAYLSDQSIKTPNVRVSLAAYSADGRLLGINSRVYAVPAGKPLRLTQQSPADVFGLDSATFTTQTFTLDNIPAEAAKVRAFLWDASTNAPICGAVEPETLSLIWSDEFGGDGIDAAKWTIPPDDNGGGNNQISYYQPSAASINTTDPGIAGSTDGSALRIQATRQTGLPRGSWSSCKLTTQNLFKVKYGRIEARIKLPNNDKGFWPAFWMMPNDSVYGGWATSGEVDIMENKSRTPDTISSALHYGGAWAASSVMSAGRNRYTTIRAGANPTVASNTSPVQYSPVDTIIPGFNTGDWHTYAVEWYPDRLEYYVDGIRYQEINTWYTTVSGNQVQQPSPMDQDFYIILNLAVGGTFDNSAAPANTTIGNMYIDYVRVYQ